MLDRTIARVYAAWATLMERDRGATMPEYALIVVGIALVAFVGAQLLGADLSSKFGDIGNTINP